MAKLARSWPPSSIRSTSSREMSASVRPAKGRVPHGQGHGVDHPGGRPQRVDLGGVLLRPQRPGDPGRAQERRLRQGALQAEQERGPRPVTDRGRGGLPGQAGDDGHGILRLAPGPDGEGSGALLDPGRLERRHDQRGVPGPGQDQHGEPFQRHGRVAGEVRQVGADRQQQHVDAQVVHPARARAIRSSNIVPKAIGRARIRRFGPGRRRVRAPSSPLLCSFLNGDRARGSRPVPGPAPSLASVAGTGR